MHLFRFRLRPAQGKRSFRSGASFGRPPSSGAVRSGPRSHLFRSNAISNRKGQTFTADSLIQHAPVGIADAEFSLEHLPHSLAEWELIELRFDSRLMATVNGDTDSRAR
jgi:hypothetical protein